MTNDSPLAAASRRRGLLQLLTGSAVLLEIPSLGGRTRVPDVHAVFAG